MFKAVQDQGVNDNELLDLKLSHILTKHSKDRCPADKNFNDDNILNLYDLIKLQAEDPDQQQQKIDQHKLQQQEAARKANEGGDNAGEISLSEEDIKNMLAEREAKEKRIRARERKNPKLEFSDDL